VTTNSGAFGGGGFGGGDDGGGIGSGGAANSNFKLFLNYTQDINSTLDPGILSSFAVITRSGYLQAGDNIRQVTTITGVDFAAFDQVYGSTFKAATGQIPLSPADDDIVVGARVSVRQNGTIFPPNDNVNVT
jgi:hypothetical protein